ncbi:MAG TPA: MerR family transcriptional regulator [Thermoleophilia bacterium]|nr:MerR family transcriptional regulator [Thermoleophilia bacterium]
MAQSDDRRPLFMISIAAELAAMHPQTLRMYERRGLLRPQRSAKNTRLYSQADVERLRRIQELTELGLNLAGVERVLELELQMTAMREQMDRLQSELERAALTLHERVREVERSFRRDLVPIRQTTAIVPVPRRRRGGR